jgi:hypothetical protein
VQVSPLPANFTANGCANCPYLLNASLASAPPGSSIQSNFIAGTQYQYVLTVIIPSLNATNIPSGPVVLSVRLNSTFAAYFPAADLAQQQVLTINLTSVLVITPQTNSVVQQSDSLGSSASPSNTVSSELERIVALLNN